MQCLPDQIIALKQDCNCDRSHALISIPLNKASIYYNPSKLVTMTESTSTCSAYGMRMCSVDEISNASALDFSVAEAWVQASDIPPWCVPGTSAVWNSTIKLTKQDKPWTARCTGASMLTNALLKPVACCRSQIPSDASLLIATGHCHPGAGVF